MRRLRSIDHRRLLHGLVAAWVLALLTLPGVLWLLGNRQPILEGRAKVEFPALNRSTLGNEATYRQIDGAVLDRLPGRGKALDLHARIALDLFKDSPNPDVAIGRDGYLYYVPELTPCRPGGQPSVDPADAVDVLARTLVAAGRTTAVAIAPSKLFVRGADAPSIDADAERCAVELERRVQERLMQTPGGLALEASLESAEETGEPTYMRTDTHWNARGREIFARRVLDRIRPGLADEVGLRIGGESRRDTDLNAMVGRPRAEGDRTVEAVRTPARPFAAGEVVLIGDSQMDQSLIRPLDGGRPIRDVALPGAVYCTWSDVAEGRCGEAIARARVIVIEKVARDVKIVTDLCWLPIALAGEQLSGPRGSWERVDGGSQPTGGSLELTGAGSAGVRIVPPGEDVSDVPRLLRLPLEHVPTGPDGAPVAVTLTQAPQAGPPAPCAMPSQAVAGGSLFLPVPAGRRASDLVVQLQGAAGTRLGPPQAISLNDPVAGRQTG